MAVLTQDLSVKKFYMGWYGNCVENCSNLDLTSLSQADKDRIHRIYQFDSTNKLLQSYTGLFNEFTTLECGIPYLIVLEVGNGTVNISNFIPTNIGTSDLGRITDSCSAETYSLSIVNESLQDSTTAYPHNENESLTFKLTTTGLNEGDTVAWEISGSNITLDDFVGLSSLTGNFTLDVNGESLLPIQLNEDSSTENAETFRLRLVNQTDVYIDVPIDDTSQSPLNLQLTSQFNPLDEGVYQNYIAHTEIELSNVDGTPLPLGGVFPFTISGSGITPDDFVGWGTRDQLYGGGDHTPFDSNLDGILTVDSGGTASIEIKTRADSTTEGPETFTITLDDHPEVSVDVTINDTSVSSIPGTLQIQPHFNNAGPSADATEVEPSSAGDPSYDYHYFKVTIPDWTGGSQLLTWEIIQDPNPPIEPEDIQIYSRQSSSSGGEVTVSSDGMSGTWQTSDYNGTGFGYQEFTPIYVLHDNLDETFYRPSENFTFKVTDEDGNSSTVIGRIEDPS